MSSQGNNIKLNNSIADTLEKFLSIERQHNLLDLRDDDVPIWELVRYPIYLSILRHLGLHAENNTAARRSFAGYWRRLWLIVVCLITRNPCQAPKDALLFIGHPRRKLEGGIYVDIYTDPFLRLLDKEYRYAVFEKSLRPGMHRKPVGPTNLYYLDTLTEMANLWRKLKHISLSAETVGICRAIEHELKERVGVTVDVEKPMLDALSRWRTQVPILRWLFRRLRPRALFVVVSAGNETVVAAAKSLGIPTAELQHGSPAAGKLNYDFPPGRVKRTFPDFFLSFGAIWTQNVHLPLPAERIIPIGFPYMAEKQEIYRHVQRESQILVLSQPTVAHVLLPFVAALAQRLEGRVPILYKIHPQEFDGWKEKYALLEKLGVTLITDKDTDLYELFSASRWQLGVYSTAIYEGLAFSCETFILDAPGSEFVRPLISAGFARLIRSPEDVELENVSYGPSTDNIFAPVSRNSIAHVVKSILHFNGVRE